MYGKLFAQMYDGTLGTKGPWQALVTFQQLIILADQDGVVDMTPEAIARRTTIPLDVIRTGLLALMEPDPESRSPDEEGRRLVALTETRGWGWRIVNYQKYRAIRSAEERREYHRNYWRDKRSKKGTAVHQPSTDSTRTQPSQPIVEAVSRSRKQKADDDDSIDVGLPEEYREDYRALRRSVRVPDSLDLEIQTLTSGRHPRAEGANPEDVGRGIRELILSGRPPNGLANWVRVAMKNRVEGIATDSADNEFTKLAKKFRAEEQRER